MGFADIAKMKHKDYRKGVANLIKKGPVVIKPLHLSVKLVKSKLGVYKFRSMAAYVACRVSHKADEKKQEAAVKLVLDAFKYEQNKELKREIVGWTTLATANVGLNCLFQIVRVDDYLLRNRAFYLLSRIAKGEFYRDSKTVNKIFKLKGCYLLTELLRSWVENDKFPTRYVRSNYNDIITTYKYKEATPLLISMLKKQRDAITIQALRNITGKFMYADPKVYEGWWQEERVKYE